MHQRRLFPLLARTYALHFAQEVVAGRLHDVFSGVSDDEKTRRELESRAAGTKALGTWHATRTIQECREACGGAGYLAVNRFAALKADTDVFTTFEGDNHVLLQLVAKGLLTDYAGEFEEMDQLGMVRFVTGMAVETVIERTSVHKLLERIKDVLPGGDKWDDEAGILDTNYHLAMLRFREEHQLAGVARRLKRGIDAGLEPGLVFSRVQDHVIAAARSHVERLVLEAFVDKLASVPESENRRALALLCDLHALSVIEADRAWFMEHGRLTVARSKAISREVGRLCRRVRPIAVELVDAFGVPPAMLRSPELVGDLVSEPFGVATDVWSRTASRSDCGGAAGPRVPAGGPAARVRRHALLATGWTVRDVWWDEPVQQDPRLGRRPARLRAAASGRGAGHGGRQVPRHAGPAWPPSGAPRDLADPAPHRARGRRCDPHQPCPSAAGGRHRRRPLGRRRRGVPGLRPVRRTPARRARPRAARSPTPSAPPRPWSRSPGRWCGSCGPEPDLRCRS